MSSKAFIPHYLLTKHDLQRFKYGKVGNLCDMREQSCKVMIAIVFGIEILTKKILGDGTLNGNGIFFGSSKEEILYFYLLVTVLGIRGW